MKIWFANLIWSICRISPEWGNRVMDFSQRLYDFAMLNHTNHKSEFMSFEEFSEKMRNKEDMRLGE